MTTEMTEAAGAGRGGRMSRQRKRDAVLRLLRGEDLETVSRALGVTAATLSGWRDAFLAAGGFSGRLWLGGEEELLAADLATAGWELVHLPDVVVHHQASTVRDPHLRRRHGLRNTLWFIWLRRPLRAALRRTRDVVGAAPRDRVTALALLDALRGAPWVLRERRPLPERVERRFRALEESQRASAARRYVS